MSIVGMGVDLVDSRRVERLISRNEDIFRDRILGPSERAEIPAAASQPERVRSYALSIAAKEAFLKALGTGLASGMRWHDIEIVKRATPAPALAVHGKAASEMAAIHADAIQLSLSSVRAPAASHVMAVVILTRADAPEIPL